jgi:hypothetical protein
LDACMAVDLDGRERPAASIANMHDLDWRPRVCCVIDAVRTFPRDRRRHSAPVSRQGHAAERARR